MNRNMWVSITSFNISISLLTEVPLNNLSIPGYAHLFEVVSYCHFSLFAPCLLFF